MGGMLKDWSEEKAKKLVDITNEILTSCQNHRLTIAETQFVLWSCIGIVMTKVLVGTSRKINNGKIDVAACTYTAVDDMAKELAAVLSTIKSGIEREAEQDILDSHKMS